MKHSQGGVHDERRVVRGSPRVSLHDTSLPRGLTEARDQAITHNTQRHCGVLCNLWNSEFREQAPSLLDPILDLTAEILPACR